MSLRMGTVSVSRHIQAQGEIVAELPDGRITIQVDANTTITGLPVVYETFSPTLKLSS